METAINQKMQSLRRNILLPFLAVQVYVRLMKKKEMGENKGQRYRHNSKCDHIIIGEPRGRDSAKVLWRKNSPSLSVSPIR